MLAGLGQRPRHRGQGLRPRVRVGDRAGHGLGLGGHDGGLLVLAGLGQRPRHRGQGLRRRSGSVIERATLSACSCWPAWASARATAVRADACRSGSVIERATLSACSCWPAWASARATAVRASRLPVRVGDRAGHALGLLVLAGLGQRLRHRGQG